MESINTIVTAGEVELAMKLEANPDPMKRITGNYYEIKKKLLLIQHEKMMKDCKTEPDRVQAQDMFHKSMQTLQHALLLDLQTELYTHFGVHSVHFKINLSVDSLYL